MSCEVERLCDAMVKRGYPLTLDSLILKEVNTGDGHWTFLDELAHRHYKKYQGEALTNYEIMRAIQIFRAEVRRRENK